MAAAIAAVRVVHNAEADRLGLAGLKKKWATITSTPNTAAAHGVSKPRISRIADPAKTNSTIQASGVALEPTDSPIPAW
jgi:hypothetical protein